MYTQYLAYEVQVQSIQEEFDQSHEQTAHNAQLCSQNVLQTVLCCVFILSQIGITAVFHTLDQTINCNHLDYLLRCLDKSIDFQKSS